MYTPEKPAPMHATRNRRRAPSPRGFQWISPFSLTSPFMAPSVSTLLACFISMPFRVGERRRMERMENGEYCGVRFQLVIAELPFGGGQLRAEGGFIAIVP